jgi:hypothetical protein
MSTETKCDRCGKVGAARHRFYRQDGKQEQTLLVDDYCSACIAEITEFVNCKPTNQAAEIARLRRERDALRHRLKQEQLSTTSERCRRIHLQACHVCEEIGCHHNTSAARATIDDLQQRLDALVVAACKKYCMDEITCAEWVQAINIAAAESKP